VVQTKKSFSTENFYCRVGKIQQNFRETIDSVIVVAFAATGRISHSPGRHAPVTEIYDFTCADLTAWK
jgi:hypothetical protein